MKILEEKGLGWF